MSWSITFPPYSQDGPNEVLAADIESAIDNAEVVGVEMAEGPARQLTEAKTLAKTALAGCMAGKRAYRVSLSGHADPGDQSTAADTLSCVINEVR